jgi:hypothetical protein
MKRTLLIGGSLLAMFIAAAGHPLVAQRGAAEAAKLEADPLWPKPFPDDGRRLQKFVYKGMQTVTKGEDQGTVWPKTSTR